MPKYQVSKKLPQVSNKGRIKSAYGVTKRGSKDGCGYFTCMTNLSKNYVHRLVMLAFGGLPADRNRQTVNHKDLNPSNNDISNLEWATMKEQNSHARLNNTNRAKCTSLSKEIQCRKIGELEWTDFESISAAARTLNIRQRTLSWCLRYQKTHAGYEYKYKKIESEENLEGEIWKNMIIEKRNTGCKISNRGRYRSKNGIISKGSLNRGYRTISVNRSKYHAHTLVARAFLGPPPSSEHTVNHKDLNTENNCVENLEYATRQEQIVHSYQNNAHRQTNAAGLSKAVEARKKGTTIWKRYSSASEAARTLELQTSNITVCCQGAIKMVNGYEFRYAKNDQDENIEGEEWKPINSVLLNTLAKLRPSNAMSDQEWEELCKTFSENYQ